MSNLRRPVSVLCLLVLLGLPVAARAESRPRSPLAPLNGLLSAAWERLTGPISSLWAADEAPVTEPAAPIIVPPPDEDSRGGWDPEG